MSELSRWTYTNTATVRPFEGVNEWGKSTYGTEYEIACTWGTNGTQERGVGGQSGASGAELVDSDTIYTEDARPKRLDMIKLGANGEWQEIRGRVEYDMSFFEDTPDYELTT